MRNIIWTDPMLHLKTLLMENGDRGTLKCSLNEEDEEDFCDYLVEQGIPFIFVYCEMASPYDLEGTPVVEVPLKIGTNYNFWENISRQPNVRPSNAQHYHLDEKWEPSARCIIVGYSKYIAELINKYAEKGVILEYGNALEAITKRGEPSISLKTDNVSDDIVKKITFSKKFMRFTMDNKDYRMRRATNRAFALIDALLVEGRNNVSDSDVLKRNGDKDAMGYDRRAKESVAYFNGIMKKKFELEFDALVRSNKVTSLNPQFVQILEVEE